MILRFEKMHGAGNDFIVMDARAESFPFSEVRSRAADLCARRTGIGADGMLLLDTSSLCDYTMHYLNADGSDAGMCGNGARCMALFAVNLGFGQQHTLQVHQNLYPVKVKRNRVSVSFPVHAIPESFFLEENEWLKIHTGTEHVVSFDPAYVREKPEYFRKTGRYIRNRLDLFPSGTNVNFSHVMDKDRIGLVTYERGVEDLTRACGTGAVAAAIGLHDMVRKKRLPDPDHPEPPETASRHIFVESPGGTLEVSFEHVQDTQSSYYKNITLHGPAVSVYQGEIIL